MVQSRSSGGQKQHDLKHRQLVFALALARTGSVEEAAKESGHSVRRAYSLARDPRVQAVVDEQRKVAVTASGIDLARCLQELACLATHNIADAYDDEGNLLPIKQWPEQLQRACAGLEVTRTARITVGEGEDETQIESSVSKAKFAGKADAIDKILRVLGAYAPDKHQHNVSFFDACLGLRGKADAA